MPKFANAHLVLNSRDRLLPGSSGVYNNFKLGNVGQNIVQGQMKDVAVSEILFPYDIPNIQAGYNVFRLHNLVGAQEELEITVPPGFYAGTDLAAEINAQIVAACVPLGIAGGDIPTCDYYDPGTAGINPNPNTFVFYCTGTGATYSWFLVSPAVFPGAPYTANVENQKDILTIMGWKTPSASNEWGAYNGSALGPSADNTLAKSGSAPLVFTQYIDICSPKLCQYQFLRDGSTTTLPRRPDLICRLYVADEISVPSPQPEGSQPFVIHRQFKNQRVMRLTAESAIGEVDIQLYDDCGQPLVTTRPPRDFQITLHVYEAGDTQYQPNVGYRY